MVYGVLDYGFNGLNKVTEKIVIKTFIPNLAVFVSNAPAKILSFVFAPIWYFSGIKESEHERLDKGIEDIVENNKFPIGFTAIMALGFIGYLVSLGLG